MWAFMALPVLGNFYGRSVLKSVELIGGVLYFVFFIVTIVTLVVMGQKSTAEFVFTESFFGQSGWENEGVQWCIGLLSITSVLTGATTPVRLEDRRLLIRTGFDGVLHLADEVSDAAKMVPKAMILAVVFNTVLALGFLITFLFCIGDDSAAVNTSTGYPIIQILYQATESKAGATIIVCIILLSTMIAIFGALASVSRLTWAFARDRGPPFSELFARVSLSV
jgi:choline transport protein